MITNILQRKFYFGQISQKQLYVPWTQIMTNHFFAALRSNIIRKTQNEHLIVAF